MKFTKTTPIQERIFFSVTPSPGYIENIYFVHPDGTFDESGILILRIDEVLKKPLRIMVNDQEWSLTINEKYGVLFIGETEMNSFLDDLFFAMEELHNVPKELRTSDSGETNKFKTLYNGEQNGEKLDDSEVIKKQGD